MMVLRTWLSIAVFVVGCSGGSECGITSDADDSSMSIATSGDTFIYENFTSSQNNDCPPGGTTVVSVTVGGTQVGSGFPITFCLPHPDRIDKSPISLADSTMIQLVDASALAGDGCTYALDGGNPTGQVTFDGFCTQAGNRYHMSFAGSAPGAQTCYTDAGPGAPTSVTLTFSGTATVEII